MPLPGIVLQPENGSPSKPVKQLQIGRWFTTLHWVLTPQEPTHGSLHLFPTQDNFNGQSWSIKHSGRQFGGAPYIPVRQEQTARFSTTLHSAFGPHGDGIHGETGGDGDFSTKIVII